jgi:ATP-dependent DNA helicase RecG
MPHGRKQIITKIIPPDKRDEVYDDIKAEMKNGRQLYVICPRIDEPDPDKELSVQAKSVEAESVRLKRDIFKDAIIATLHSKVKKEAKEKVMKDFLEHKADILVATSVVEVGVNVPNATIIIIEGAERFGLAQLHQLRGRVVRSNHQAYCYIFAESGSQKTIDRLKAFQNAKNGFELAELDMQLRGAGELTGGKQWGLSDIGMEAIKNLKMVEAARSEAISLVQKNEIVNYPELVAKVANRIQINHFE